jgi:DNA 3'-phosphatase
MNAWLKPNITSLSSSLSLNEREVGKKSLSTNIIEQSNQTKKHNVKQCSSSILICDPKMITFPVLYNVEDPNLRNLEPCNTWRYNESNGIMFKLNSDSIKDNIPKKKQIIYGFDMDGTLINTKSKKKFPEDEYDWELFDNNIPDKLREIYEKGIYIVIISNQNGIGTGKSTREQIQRKVDAIINKINVPMDFICSIDDDIYRKPLPGMWDLVKTLRCKSIDKENSMYIGDAAGRDNSKTTKKNELSYKKDFSNSDLKFALNNGSQVRINNYFIIFIYLFIYII